jgi:hypothetical protein
MKKALFFLAMLVIFAIIFVGYSGFFYSPEISEKRIGPFTMVLMEHRGSYYDAQDTFDQVNAILSKVLNTGTLTGIGLYYDDPAKVKEEDLRSDCGFILDRSELDRLGALKKRLIIRELKKTTCVTGEFPIKNFLSYMTGPARVYPKMGEYIKAKKLRTSYGIELYDMGSKKIIYCMPVVEEKN